jgi:hypothetical protein
LPALLLSSYLLAFEKTKVVVTMWLKTTRVVSAVAGTLVLLTGARSAKCEVPFLLRPVVNLGKMTAVTATQVAKTGVAAATTVATTPKTVYVKVTDTISAKKKKK